ncbi:hypothetical protein NW755_014318 [Fusarium falciforme]|uniref:Heterokaryon incompatibility domain-containing protein n=1 Tax=Fusarium falciforme TaxID=195108 RepID=A0A9W8QU76_9HYPO|nr:hypothetical protein NW755_014318 [Fusarium falciforme]
MWLIDTTSLSLEYHHIRPRVYAILSHCWGLEETSFQEWQSGKRDMTKAGISKIVNACKLARAEQYDYLWVDTNCIDKTSSSELSEAINSMFQYYRDAGVCYAYLADVPGDSHIDSESGSTLPEWESPDHPWSSFRRSAWFTRGWTLQELVAPRYVKFYSASWSLIGAKSGLVATISQITNIRSVFLSGHILMRASISERMSWVSNRVTTRPEDIAYCMMGIFDINMPLLYGEGGQKAFVRLQEEICRVSADQTILAWEYLLADNRHKGNFPAVRYQHLVPLVGPTDQAKEHSPWDWSSSSHNHLSALAPDPICFYASAGLSPIVNDRDFERLPWVITNQGLSINLPLARICSSLQTPLEMRYHSRLAFAFLSVSENSTGWRAAFVLNVSPGKARYSRNKAVGSLLLVDIEDQAALFEHMRVETIYLCRLDNPIHTMGSSPFTSSKWGTKIGFWYAWREGHEEPLMSDARGWSANSLGLFGQSQPISILAGSALVIDAEGTPVSVLVTVAIGEDGSLEWETSLLETKQGSVSFKYQHAGREMRLSDILKELRTTKDSGDVLVFPSRCKSLSCMVRKVSQPQPQLRLLSISQEMINGGNRDEIPGRQKSDSIQCSS